MRRIGDSDYGHWLELMELETTPQQDADCLFLERHGQRFLVDFGTENAHEKVLELKHKQRWEQG